MGDRAKTKAQLIDELEALRQRVAALEAAEIERKQIEGTLQRYSERLEILQEIGQAVLEGQWLEDVVSSALHYLQRLKSYRHISLALIEFDSNETVAVVAKSNDKTQPAVGGRFPLQKSKSLSLLEQNQPYLVEDLAALADRSPVEENLLDEGIRSLLTIPLISREQLIGAINLGADSPEAFLPEDIEISRAVANLLAVGIENVQLYEETRQKAEEVTALNTISQAITASLDLQEILDLITVHTTRLLVAAAASVVLHDENRGDLWFATASGRGAEFMRGQRLAWGQGIIGWVIEHGESLLIPDVHEDPRFFPDFDQKGGFTTDSILCAPLRAKAQIIGAIEVINKQEGSFGEADQRLLHALTASAAIAIENARLFKQAQQEIAERQQAEMALRQAYDEVEMRVLARTMELAEANDNLKQEIAERKQIARALRVSEAKWRSLVENAPDIISTIDRNGTILFVNHGIEIDSFAEREIGRNILDHLVPEYHEEVKERIERAFQTGNADSYEIVAFTSRGRRWFSNRIGPVKHDDHVVALTIISSDITERKIALEQLEYTAWHDTLTGLPNRALFIKRLEQAIEQAKRHEDYLFAVLFIDLDRFKIINDSLGHLVGDQFLKTIARRLEKCVRIDDTVARLGGDEFTVLVDNIRDISQAQRIANRVQKEVALPVKLEGRHFFTSASIGIASSVQKYERPEDLLRDADTALYQAKAQGKARHQLFDNRKYMG